jgi:voltage-gated potassium channel Kch
MGIGASVFLIAVGAILAWAVNISVSGLDLATVGYILMIAGVIGLIWSLFVFGGSRGFGRRTVVDEYDDPAYRRREVVRDDYV